MIYLLLPFLVLIVAEWNVIYNHMASTQESFEPQYLLLLGANGREDSTAVRSRAQAFREAIQKWPNAKLVISGNEKRNEISAYLKNLNLSDSENVRMTVEDKSRNTYENIAFSIDKTKLNDVLIVTSAYHQPRAVCIARKFGLKAKAFDTDTLDHGIDLSIWLRERASRVKLLFQKF